MNQEKYFTDYVLIFHTTNQERREENRREQNNYDFNYIILNLKPPILLPVSEVAQIN